MKKTGIFLFLIYFVYSNLLLAQNVKTEAPYLFSKLPQLKNFINLKELYRIPLDDESGKYQYYIRDTWGIDADNDMNLYIADYFNCTITVFDKNGKYLRTMGGKGQGPGELINPETICIIGKRIYIYEHLKGIKTLDLNGRYVDFAVAKFGNFRLFKPLGDNLLTVNYIHIPPKIGNPPQFAYPPEEAGYHLEIYSKDFTKIKRIVTLQSDDHLMFIPDYALAVDSYNRIYFLNGRNDYKINTYSADGKLLYSFGREYKRIPYSKKLIEDYKNNVRNNSTFLKAIEEQKYPQVVSMIFTDNKGYIWVVVGECSVNNGSRYKITSTVDIFNDKGEYLYTFESPYFLAYNFIKNGRLYSRQYQDDLNIRVFEIQYNK